MTPGGISRGWTHAVLVAASKGNDLKRAATPFEECWRNCSDTVFSDATCTPPPSVAPGSGASRVEVSRQRCIGRSNGADQLEWDSFRPGFDKYVQIDFYSRIPGVNATDARMKTLSIQLAISEIHRDGRVDPQGPFE